MGLEQLARVAGELFDLLLPVLGVGLDHLGLADDPVEHQAEQLLFVADVPVQRGRAGVQLLRELAHRDALQAFALHQPQCGVDDLVPREGHLTATAYSSRTLFEMTRTVFENAIEATGLAKRYGEVQALDGVDLHVEAGTVFGLLGPNGAGKSTTVRILTTLSRPDAGTVRVAGVDALRDPVGVRRAIGVVGQKHGFDAEATGRENLVLQAELYGLRDRGRVDELLERFGLAEAAGRLAKTYSGGMQRRLDVALGLIHSPQVLFLDEPTTGLDPEARTAMWAEIERLAREERMTILLTTHYLEEADQLAVAGRDRRPRQDRRARHAGRAQGRDAGGDPERGAAVAQRRVPDARRKGVRGMNGVRQTWQVSLRYFRVLVRQPAFLLITIVQPLIWLLLFGALFKSVTQIPGFGGTEDYLDYLTPGIVVMLAVSSAGWTGMGFIEDINSGVMDRMLVTPAWRGAFNLGSVAQCVVSVVLQTLLIIGLALLLGAEVAHAGVLILVAALLAAAFASLSNGLGVLDAPARVADRRRVAAPAPADVPLERADAAQPRSRVDRDRRQVQPGRLGGGGRTRPGAAADRPARGAHRALSLVRDPGVRRLPAVIVTF